MYVGRGSPDGCAGWEPIILTDVAIEALSEDQAADILAHMDPETGTPLVDLILDTAEQKGTGKWASQIALDLGVTAPTIANAVFARTISGLHAERAKAAKVLPGPVARTAGPRDAVPRVRRLAAP